MTLDDHHLVLLMEESNEAGLELLAALLATSKRCSKQLRFGRDEVQPGQLLANHQRLRGELLDVLACIRFLELSRQIEPIRGEDVDIHMIEKQAKIDRMLALSRSQGRLEDSIAKSIDSTSTIPQPPAPPPMRIMREGIGLIEHDHRAGREDCPACKILHGED